MAASLYYIYASLPSPASIDDPYFGLSPGGLSRGQEGVDYQGHVFWDMVTKSEMFSPTAANTLH